MSAQGGKKPLKQVRLIDAAPSSQRAAFRRMRIVRGALPPEFFEALTIPHYQRNAMGGTKHDELVEAFDPETGSGVPDDVSLCVHVDNARAASGGEVIIRSGELIVLDGHQRVDALMERVRNNLLVDPLGVKVFLGTHDEEERFLFYQQNRKQTPVTTHVFVRNSDDTEAIATLKKKIKANPDFVTVQWDQERPRGNYITALMLYDAAVVIHGCPLGSTFEEIIEYLDELTAKFGTSQIVENTQIFFRVVEQCFNKDDRRKYTYRKDAVLGLAALFRDYRNFWAKGDPNHLQVLKNDIAKIQGFALTRLEAALGQKNPSALTHMLEAHFSTREVNPLVVKPNWRKAKNLD